ncbi:M20 metallopeptidase family protein [Bifidobacterium criceti]|uniref:N-acyl-L-amino acid amidohydrolase n=1 Tax=Bifidobacterium criceti TaxID=1960969 RepID=A0A2A2EDT0_9BIFI|nr:amidohydrolase [Bifidobacterium criceti]PAU67102.1 N-acyl-L-amino acid amidohydrolase [Bifidobacterium criceti]
MAVTIDLTDELRDIRHHLHMHPERSFEEHDTSAFLTSTLERHGVDVLANPMPTGAVAHIEGAHPGPVVGLRADIDALPVHEETGLPFASRADGVMHACGHDLHMTSLLGAVFWLNAHRDLIHGTLRIIFQPAEELGRGARAVIDAGLADGLDAIIGTHNNPNYAPGTLAAGPQPMMAGCVRFHVTLHAEGTHGGYPHKGTGPFEAMSSMILALQTIVSRNTSPFHPLVLSVTEVHGGDVWNVIPAEAGFQGTARYFHREDGDLAARRFRQIVMSTAAAYGITADIEWDDFQAPLVCDADLTAPVVEQIPSYADLAPIMPSMAGEDFAEYAEVTRLVFAFVGSNGTPGCADWHSPHFVGFDGTVAAGAAFYANAALTTLHTLAAE